MTSSAVDLRTWIIPDALFDGQDLLERHAAWIEDGFVTEVTHEAAVPVDSARRVVRGILTPGFLDLQVNGGGGVLFNSRPSVDGIAQIVATHRAAGTSAIFPTVITDSREVLAAAVEAAISAKGLPGFAGLHIEGPHISRIRHGAHAEAYIRPIDERTFAMVGRLIAADVPVMITLAPEETGSDAIRRLSDMGAIVSLGHSNATAEEAEEAFAAGAKAVTHLFNAMSPMTSRAPGVTGAAISGEAWCGLIADGHHVDDRMIRLALSARPRGDRTFFVSDAMPTVGGGDVFSLYGREISLTGGRLVNSEGALSGAHLTLQGAVRRAATEIGLNLEHALRMALTFPAELAGLEARARLIGRSHDEVFVLTNDLSAMDSICSFTGPRAV